MTQKATSNTRIGGHKERGDVLQMLKRNPVVYARFLELSEEIQFEEQKDHYRHHARQVFDTNLNLELLQEYIYIPLDIFLDIFRKNNHNISTELDAWLLFLASDDPADILRLVEKYPRFRELYADIIAFQQKPEELVNMYSKALEIMDRNTVKYMIEEQKQALEKQAQLLLEKDTALAEKDAQLQILQQELEALKKELPK